MRRERIPIVLVIAPSRFLGAKTIEANGLDVGKMESMRIITSAQQLRGWGRGTPYVTGFRETWGDCRATRELDDMLTLRVQACHLRPANERDLAPLMRHGREAAE